MRTNLPVTQREVEISDGAMLVSTTDAQGRITHANAVFVAISGYDYDELLGQPHNLVRHPDVPPEAFGPLLLIETPRLLFPFARAIVAHATREAGFPPLNIAPVDFVALYRQQLEAAGGQIPGIPGGPVGHA